MSSVAKRIAPAKLNLYLAVTGVREIDGYHELDSIVAQLDWGDEVEIETGTNGSDEFFSDTSLEWNEHNLIYKALALYRKKSGLLSPVRIRLKKNIPYGSGLGGGSSDAVATLLALNTLYDDAVDVRDLMTGSAELGSDCPLFFANHVCWIRGRGERVEPFRCEAFERGQWKVILFYPGFEISAGWAYASLRQMAPLAYSSPQKISEELLMWKTDPKPWMHWERNDLSIAVNPKYSAIPVLQQQFKEQFGRPLQMSGSGSTCFCLLEVSEDPTPFFEFVRERWGEDCLMRSCFFRKNESLPGGRSVL